MARKINPTDKHVGNRLRMRRLMLGLTQTAIAAVSNISFQQVQKYEKGTNRLSSSRMQQFADALQVVPTFFFEGLPGGDMPREDMQAKEISTLLATKDGVMLVSAFIRIERPSLKRAIVHLVEELAG